MGKQRPASNIDTIKMKILWDLRTAQIHKASHRTNNYLAGLPILTSDNKSIHMDKEKIIM